MFMTGALGALALLSVFCSTAQAAATPLSLETSTIHSTFSSNFHEDVNLRFVKDSGVCETTPGVHQISGYIDVGTNMSMVYRLAPCLRDANMCRSGFGSSNRVNLQRPLRSLFGSFHFSAVFVDTHFHIRLNGGPGCSSMILSVTPYYNRCVS